MRQPVILNVVILTSALLAAGCSGPTEQPASRAAAPPPTAPAPKIPLTELPKIEPQPILDRIKVLSSDEFEGRAPGPRARS